MRGFLYELDYYEVVRHSRGGINGAQSEGSHLPRNRDNNDLPACLLCSFPVRFPALSLCNNHPRREFEAGAYYTDDFAQRSKSSASSAACAI